MEKAPNKSEATKKAVEAYKNNENLSMRAAVRMYGCNPKLISNHLNSKTKPAPDYFIIYQKLSPIEENVLAQHIIRAYSLEFPLTIQYLNNCANKLLRKKDINATINYHWHNNFFKRYSEINSKLFRSIDRQRINTENSDNFIE
jgi:hypothetical protein